MGSAIAQRLASLGHEMMVWNRSADKARSLGLPVAATPQALASACEMVISILTDANAVDQVYGEMLKADVKGKLFIEMSTVRPDVQKALSQKVLSRGARLVECPVGGTIGPAKEGKLFGFAGGEAADVARAKPVLDQMCRRVEHVGPIGSGARFKLAINLPLLVYWQALGEALSLVRDLQIERLLDLVQQLDDGHRVESQIIAQMVIRSDSRRVAFQIGRKRLNDSGSGRVVGGHARSLLVGRIVYLR